MRTHLPAFVLVALTATIGAQARQSRREPIRGSAELADGTPWANATVHLLSRPLPLDERIGTADEQSAVTDGKGRFTVQLLTGRQYLAWAVEELDGERYRSSFPVERLIAGRPLALVADEPTTRQRLAFDGLEHWAGRGDIVGRLISTTEPRHVATAALTADGWRLPPMPGRHARLEITVGGLPLFQWPHDIDLRAEGDTPRRLPAPREVRVRVTDPQGQPVADAALSLRSIDPPDGMRDCDHPLARTDASGDAVVTLPLPPGRRFAWHNYAFGIRARGFAPVGNVETVELPAVSDPASGEPELLLPLGKGTTHDLVLSRGEQPFTAPLVCNTATAAVGGNFRFGGDAQRHIAPDEDGKLVIHRMASMPAVLTAPTDTLAAVELLAPLHPMALLGCIRANEPRPELRWNLDALTPRTMLVTMDGIPQPAAQLAVLVQDSDEMARALSGMVTDRAGRIAALLPPDLPVVVVAWNDGGFAVARSRRDEGEPIELVLTRIRSLPGRVLAPNGEPCAFATVECHVFDDTIDDYEIRAVATAVKLLKAPTDRDGTFRLPLLPGTHYSLRGVATPAGDHYLDRDWQVGTNDPDELDLDLGKAH